MFIDRWRGAILFFCRLGNFPELRLLDLVLWKNNFHFWFIFHAYRPFQTWRKLIKKHKLKAELQLEKTLDDSTIYHYFTKKKQKTNVHMSNKKNVHMSIFHLISQRVKKVKNKTTRHLFFPCILILCQNLAPRLTTCLLTSRCVMLVTANVASSC